MNEETKPRVNYLNVAYGIKSWLLTSDHKRIALLYLASVTFFFFLGGAFENDCWELLTPPGDLMQSDTYNKMFSMHGMIMVFRSDALAIPATLEIF